jgi:hypothetical protein
VTAAIADYLLDRENVTSASALRARLSRVLDYLDFADQNKVACEAIDERWIDRFRVWALDQSVVSARGLLLGAVSAGTVEGSVRALQSAINFAHSRHETSFPAAFTPKKPKDVSVTPLFRADIKLLASMFAYAMAKRDRRSLLRFLQISIATWCRPDAAHDFSTDPKRRQWLDNAQIISLNPSGRAQTRKHRATVPVGDRMASLIRDCKGYYVGVSSVRKAFEAMQAELEMPGERESGLKLIRRSIAHIVRQRIGEEHWVQGKIMLGHHQTSTSDLYALPDPANLGRALEATNQVIEEIETLVPGAFLRINTGLAPDIKIAKGKKMAENWRTRHDSNVWPLPSEGKVSDESPQKSVIIDTQSVEQAVHKHSVLPKNTGLAPDLNGSLRSRLIARILTDWPTAKTIGFAKSVMVSVGDFSDWGPPEFIPDAYVVDGDAKIIRIFEVLAPTDDKLARIVDLARPLNERGWKIMLIRIDDYSVRSWNMSGLSFEGAVA